MSTSRKRKNNSGENSSASSAVEEESVATSTRSGEALVFRFGASECEKILPAFNPADKQGLSAEAWVSAICTFKKMFLWDDMTTIFYGSLRLEEAAKIWFQTHKSQLLTWEHFKRQFIKAFPSTTDESTILLQIMARTKRQDESVENYFYDVVGLCARARMLDSMTMNYIISGFNDENLINTLTASNSKMSKTQKTSIRREQHS